MLLTRAAVILASAARWRSVSIALDAGGERGRGERRGAGEHRPATAAAEGLAPRREGTPAPPPFHGSRLTDGGLRADGEERAVGLLRRASGRASSATIFFACRTRSRSTPSGDHSVDSTASAIAFSASVEVERERAIGGGSAAGAAAAAAGGGGGGERGMVAEGAGAPLPARISSATERSSTARASSPAR